MHTRFGYCTTTQVHSSSKMKTSFLVVILAMATTPVFSYSSFYDMLTKTREEPKAEPLHFTVMSRDEDLGQNPGDTNILEEVKEMLKFLERLRRLRDTVGSTDEKSHRWPQNPGSFIEEVTETFFDTVGKSINAKKYFNRDVFDKKK